MIAATDVTARRLDDAYRIGSRVRTAARPDTISAGTFGFASPTADTRGAAPVWSKYWSDVPAVSESVPGYEASGWVGIGAPRNTAVEIIDRLNKEINAGLADPTIKLRITELGHTVFAGSPGEFGKYIVEFTEKWGKVIRAANIKL
jgi:tripartite-type tricarboxylate transporter receptor subunit TctC